MSAISDMVNKYSIAQIVVGLPKSMKGSDSAQTRLVREFINQLSQTVSIPVHSVDERLSSVSATKILVQKGIRSGEHKSEIDKTAAAIILQEYLDSV